jgi:hypothetical protein
MLSEPTPDLCIALMLTLATIGCGISGGGGCRDKPDLVIFALYDLSGSVEQQRAQYLEESNVLLNAIYNPTEARKHLSYEAPFHGETAFAADLITANSLAFARIPVHACFPAFNLLTSMQQYNKQSSDASELARKQVNDVVARAKTTDLTDILGAVLAARKVLFNESAGTAKYRYLILFSDMVHETKEYNFTREPLTNLQIGSILGTEKKADRLPDLRGVKVWVAGAGASSDSRMTQARLLWIQKFWITYFKDTGADLTDARYAGTLNDFRMPEK